MRGSSWLRVAGGVIAIICGYSLYVHIEEDFGGTRRIARNFYGNLLTLDTHREDPRDNVRELYHGPIKHGEQYFPPRGSGVPSPAPTPSARKSG